MTINEEITERAFELLGYHITSLEIELMSHIQQIMMHDKKIDLENMKSDETEILSEWKHSGYAEIDEYGNIYISKEFWDSINELLWMSYVAPGGDILNRKSKNDKLPTNAIKLDEEDFKNKNREREEKELTRRIIDSVKDFKL